MDDNTLNKMRELLDRLPPGPALPLVEPEEKCVCGKTVPIKNLKIANSGIKTYISDVCKDCPNGDKLDKETAKLVCYKCGKVVARLSPGEDPIDKFVIKPGKTLHLMECTFCSPPDNGEKGKEYYIVEKLIWQKKLKNK